MIGDMIRGDIGKKTFNSDGAILEVTKIPQSRTIKLFVSTCERVHGAHRLGQLHSFHPPIWTLTER